MEKTDLLSMTQSELTEYIVSLGEPKYRATQIFGWLCRGADLDSMSNVPRALCEKLKETAFVPTAKIEKKQVSSDGTVKYLFSMYDGECVESVLMKYKYGNTICISSEVGCPMGCAFCASTLGGIKRKLLPSEMLAQIIAAQNDAGERISNIVMMGIGEPLDNYDNVIKFLRLVGAPEGLNIGYRHISLSTCGIVDKIYALAKEDFPITLSVSLHASDDETRSALMPVNKRWNIEALLCACSDYFSSTGRRISFEYTLVRGKNDSAESAKKLAAVLHKYCKNMPLHVNLIPVNNVTERGLLPTERGGVDVFAKTLVSLGVNATVRRKLGSDIDASCGQLRAKAQNIKSRKE
ncbi:MAG: 23S rRNA (adenine(2503)-C(2))-methyltransferase RlmN [Clostridiales bacterium]|nr:23S rRNA (adenine(2503)-C(2))-methyltransferase RlmN [Clostridiales bacterium]